MKDSLVQWCPCYNGAVVADLFKRFVQKSDNVFFGAVVIKRR